MYSKIQKFAILLFLFLVFSSPAQAVDGTAVTFSVSPPLFKVNMKPGDSWSSFVKVINNNPYPVSVYAEVANFKSNESGGVEFIRDDSNSDYSKYMLSQWMTFADKVIDIPSFSSQDVPFSINLPAKADPGGHYAAILLGNKPTDEASGNVIKFSSKIASLILLKVEGDVKEQGDVTEFSYGKLFNTSLSASFQVKFRNQGNVHIHPEGQIKITNIFGEERGNIEINRSQNFGNILPESEKKWVFNWYGTNSLLDAGLMKAELLLNYGAEGKQTVYRTMYFWTINLKPTLIAIGSLSLIILIIIWMIRRYIRSSVEQMKLQMGVKSAKAPARGRPAQALGGRKKVAVSKQILAKKEKETVIIKIMNWSLLKKSIILSVIFVVFLVALSVYVYHREYGFFNDEYIADENANVIVAPVATSTMLATTSDKDTIARDEAAVDETALNKEILIVDGSGQRDLLGRVKGLLTANNVAVADGSLTDVVYSDIAAVIKFNAGQLESAQAIDELLNKQAELRQEETDDGRIILILGSKFK